jgi:hypothetical protein
MYGSIQNLVSPECATTCGPDNGLLGIYRDHRLDSGTGSSRHNRRGQRLRGKSHQRRGTILDHLSAACHRIRETHRFVINDVFGSMVGDNDEKGPLPLGFEGS